MCSCPVCGICTASYILTFLTLPPLVSPIWQKSLSQRSLRSGQIVMDSGILLKLKEEVTCPICLELLTEPLSLCCGHTFCQACITANNKESIVSKERESSCPVCRSSYQLGILQPNRHVANIVETLREANLSPEEEQKTDLCEHHGEKLLLFCKEDGKLICWLCERSQEHRGHHTFLMEEVAQEYQVTDQDGGKTGQKIIPDGKCLLCIDCIYLATLVLSPVITFAPMLTFQGLKNISMYSTQLQNNEQTQKSSRYFL